MKRQGIHHVGLVTADIDRTIEFYTQKLGFELAFCDVVEPPGGGKIKHAFFDTGDGSYVAFMAPENMPGIPEKLATDLNSAQSLPGFFYHFAFWLDDLDALEAKRTDLARRGVDVSPIVDHEWCRSIYFRDPNGLLLEFSASIRKLDEGDRVMRPKGSPPPVADPEQRRKAFEILMQPTRADPARAR